MSASAWRDLALKFDAHRMQAIAHLQAMLQDPVLHAPVVREFLAAAPQPAQSEEPDAEVVGHERNALYRVRTLRWHLPEGAKLYTAPQPDAEPRVSPTFSDSVVREKARLEYSAGMSYAGWWNDSVHLVTRLAGTYYAKGWRAAEAAHGIAAPAQEGVAS